MYNFIFTKIKKKNFLSYDWYLRILIFVWNLYLFFVFYKIIEIFLAEFIYKIIFFLCYFKIKIITFSVLLLFILSLKKIKD